MNHNGDIIKLFKQRDYIMMNNALGRGAFGKTVLLKDPYIDELFVAKKYEPISDEIKERFFSNFLDEIKILHKLNHRNVVRIYNYYPYEKQFSGIVLMEFVNGKSIDEYFQDYLPFYNLTADDTFVQLIDGFQYIESMGVVHRDIREGNILVDEENAVVKIIDFGIGKIVDNIYERTDSLVNDINRQGSDTLPQEYYEGVYTSKTDMYYLAELFNRLMRESNLVCSSDFSYHTILEKMMSKQPEDRYESFNEVREAIDKHDFIGMNISHSDKSVYKAFADSLYAAISMFIDERVFNRDINHFVQQLETVLKDNAFENVIQYNPDVIRCIIGGKYKYKPSEQIYCSSIKEFLEWFKKATTQSQQLIINNLVAKLSTIKVEVTEDFDLPF